MDVIVARWGHGTIEVEYFCRNEWTREGVPGLESPLWLLVVTWFDVGVLKRVEGMVWIIFA